MHPRQATQRSKSSVKAETLTSLEQNTASGLALSRIHAERAGPRDDSKLRGKTFRRHRQQADPDPESKKKNKKSHIPLPS